MNGIIIENLTIGYRRKTVAERISATIQRGQLTCLIGRNGLGKSTLLRTLAGFQQPLGGKITLQVGGRSYDLAATDKATLARLVSVVLTEKVDVSNMTAADIVAMGRMPYTNFFGTLRTEDRKAVGEAMRMVGMEAFARRDIGTLSDGERQKIMIARALAQQTPAMLLDEPTAFLDYPSKVETMSLLANLANDMGKIVVASTHDLDIALRTADRLLTIDPQHGLVEIGKETLQEKIKAFACVRQKKSLSLP